MDAKYKPMFTGSERGIELSVREAQQKIRKFNCNRKKTDRKAFYLSESLLKKIVSQQGVVGIRIYYGMDEKSDLDSVIVGVNQAGENVFSGELHVNGEKDMPAGESGIYASASFCPNRCPSASSDLS